MAVRRPQPCSCSRTPPSVSSTVLQEISLESYSLNLPRPCCNSPPRAGQASRPQLPISTNAERYAAMVTGRRAFVADVSCSSASISVWSRYRFIEIIWPQRAVARKQLQFGLIIVVYRQFLWFALVVNGQFCKQIALVRQLEIPACRVAKPHNAKDFAMHEHPMGTRRQF